MRLNRPDREVKNGRLTKCEIEQQVVNIGVEKAEEGGCCRQGCSRKTCEPTGRPHGGEALRGEETCCTYGRDENIS